jgi:hypothetical protein
MATRSPSPNPVLTATATAADTRGRTIRRDVKEVTVIGVATNADDWITLPSLNTVPVGHTIRIMCNAGGNFELRTPAGSGETINDENCDGTKEYLCTDTDLIIVTKQSSAGGWFGQSITSLGAVRAAVVPD